MRDALVGGFPEPDYVERPGSESEETEESDGSGVDWNGRTHFVEAWISPGDPSRTLRLAFATVNRPAEVEDMKEFVLAAVASVLPTSPVEILPTSRGDVLIKFASLEDREAARERSPVVWGDLKLALERPEETSNRFNFVPQWLVLVALSDFPIEMWKKEKILECFTAGCRVVEINPECLEEDNYAPLELILEVNHYLDCPSKLSVSGELGGRREGSVVQIAPLRVWSRDEQLGPDRSLRL